MATYTFAVEVDWEEPPPQECNCCNRSIGRAFNGLASAYAAAQVQPRRVRRFQQRTLTVDFNGALPPDDLIARVRWDCTSPWVTYLSRPGIADSRRLVCVNVRFNYSGIGSVKATIETVHGDSLNYEFAFTVADAPMYPSATYETANGPYSVTAQVDGD